MRAGRPSTVTLQPGYISSASSSMAFCCAATASRNVSSSTRRNVTLPGPEVTSVPRGWLNRTGGTGAVGPGGGGMSEEHVELLELDRLAQGKLGVVVVRREGRRLAILLLPGEGHRRQLVRDLPLQVRPLPGPVRRMLAGEKPKGVALPIGVER